MSVEAQRQEKLDTTEERDFRKEMLLGKYTAKVLYRWDNGKFKANFLLYTKEILSNFGNALADSSGDFTDLLTKIQNHSISSPYSQVKYFGTIAKNLIVTTSPICGK